VSGIAGLWHLDGQALGCNELEAMLARLAHRGPDGMSAWTGDAVGLGHLMLHTTAESRDERQPLATASGDVVLTADARIDNRDELVATLGPTPTDAELILRAYTRWGEDCPKHLTGDFAFAIWDARRQRLFCARDHFGVKPFYYHHALGRLFALASEIKGLLALPDVPRRLNEQRVADYLLPLLDDKEATFYRDIRRLPPAQRLIVTRTGVRIEPYWALDPTRELRLGSNAEYAEAFREVFTEAVRCRLRSTRPLGAMLSGGLDSSSIVCVARALLTQEGHLPLHTFSAVFDEVTECDERGYIETVLRGSGLRPHYVAGDRLTAVGELATLLEEQDEPPYAPNLFLHSGLYCAAREAGVGVLLDGFDGDITVSHGIAFLCELAQTGRWIQLTREVDGLARRFGGDRWPILRGHVLTPLTPELLRRTWRALRRCPPLVAEYSLLNRAFARRTEAAERLRLCIPPPRTARADHYRRLTLGIVPLVLEIADRAAARTRLVPRYPFFDRRVAEFCLALPGDQKLWRGWTRIVLRRGMAGTLPPEVQWRGGKANLSSNFIRRLVSESSGLSALEDVAILEPYVDLSALRTSLERLASNGNERDALTVWKATLLARWLRQSSLAAGDETRHRKEEADGYQRQSAFA
jgi:asparagine synthase (glutamine-hydrolysing)